MQSIAKKPAATATNKETAGDEAESVEEPRTPEAALDATLQISYKWVSLPKLRFC